MDDCVHRDEVPAPDRPASVDHQERVSVTGAGTPSQVLNMLIDWDNINPMWRNRGVAHVIATCLSRIDVSAVPPMRRIKVRLYGGWYRETVISRVAQALVPQLEEEFPRPERVWRDVHTLVEGDLARSIAQAPATTYTHTFRERSTTGHLAVAAPPFPGCRNPAACPIAHLHSFLGANQCSQPDCAVSRDMVVSKPEQKLVDTMLAVDLFHFSRFSNRWIAVVSSDDDLFPAIHAAILNGASVLHIHPNPGRTSPVHYARLLPERYLQATF